MKPAPSLAQLNVLLLKEEEMLLHSSLLLLWLQEAHRIVMMAMAMVYLTQGTGVLITLIHDASKKEIPLKQQLALLHSNNSNPPLL
jgi:hypothetical protein